MRSLISRKILSGLGLSALLVVGASLSMQGCNSATTAPDPTAGDTSTLLLLSPRGGETFKVGQTINVTWREQGAHASDINAVDVKISQDAGKTWTYLNNGSIAKGAAGWESYSWKIPMMILPPNATDSVSLVSTTVKLRIQEYTYPNVYYEITPATFTITQ